MIFKSKAKILQRLRNDKINVPHLEIYNVSKYKKNKKKILDDIRKKFKKLLAVRSSNVFEDKNKTNAGLFYSSVNINPKNKIELEKAINKTIDSYKGYANKKNEFFIQEMVDNVYASGVCFTKNINNGLPQWKINFTKNKDTTLVTSGKGMVQSINFLDSEKTIFKEKVFHKLYLKIKEIQKKIQHEDIDVEFIINKKYNIFFVQVRKLPLVNSKKPTPNVVKLYEKLEKKITKRKEKNSDLYGKTTFFGTMPDWNPAEILGTKPRPLALSLYQELITNHIWSLSRNEYGYKELFGQQLLTTFYGIPYVDIRVDFNSWLPESLNEKLSRKLVNYYLDKFKSDINNHDKIEFEIIFSSFNFLSKKKIPQLLKGKFQKKEIVQIIEGLKATNQKAFNNLNKQVVQIEKLKKKQSIVENQNIYWVDKIISQLNNCKKYGTTSFAGLARSAFISVDMINSMVVEGILSEKEKNNFLNSIKTISSEINQALYLDKKKFKKKYGHLRPDTYEITSPNYRDGFDLYFNKIEKNHKQNKKNYFKLNFKQVRQVNSFLKKNNFSINCGELFLFFKKSIELREYSKFVFTKSIDQIFQNLKKFGKRNRIKVDDLSYLTIQNIIDIYYNLEYRSINRNLSDKINNNKQNYIELSNINLPEVIIEKNDIYYFEEKNTKVNFVGTDKASGKVLHLRKMHKTTNLSKKIICIENADPGYDFLFSKNISGLITKYGGANSHMAIRCYELGIPAAIGVGNYLFEDIIKKKFIDINCEIKKIF